MPAALPTNRSLTDGEITLQVEGFDRLMMFILEREVEEAEVKEFLSPNREVPI
jgi:hypothetical protein